MCCFGGCLTGDFIEEDDGEYGADLGEEDDFFNGDGDKALSGKKRKDGGGKGGLLCWLELLLHGAWKLHTHTAC